MLDVKLPQDAVIQLCRAVDDAVGHTGETCVSIALPYRVGFDLPLLASPMAMVDHAVAFLGQHRKNIDKMAATLTLRAREQLAIRVDVLGAVVEFRPTATDLHASVTIDAPIAPVELLRVFVRLGLLHRLLAEECRFRVGRAGYMFADVRLPELAPDITRKQAALVPARVYMTGDEDMRLLDRVDTAEVFLQDCAMFSHQNKTIGLRSQWLRRVAIPVVMAHRHIVATPNKEGALIAHGIVERCADRPLRVASQLYLRQRYGLTEGEIHDQQASDPLIRS